MREKREFDRFFPFRNKFLTLSRPNVKIINKVFLDLWESTFKNDIILVTKNFFSNSDFKNECKNELKDTNEKLCSWSRKRVSRKIDFMPIWTHDCIPIAWELIFFDLNESVSLKFAWAAKSFRWIFMLWLQSRQAARHISELRHKIFIHTFVHTKKYTHLAEKWIKSKFHKF